MPPNLKPKSRQWLNDLVLNIENSVRLYFPDNVKRELKLEYLDPLDAFGKIFETNENKVTFVEKIFKANGDNDFKQFYEQIKVDMKESCDAGSILGIADEANNKVYIVRKSLENVVKEDLIEDYVFYEPDYIKYKLSKPKEKEKMVKLVESLLTVHELGHILLNYLLLQMNIKPQTSTAKALWEKYIAYENLDESFADYIMIDYYRKMCNSVNMKFKIIMDLFINDRCTHMERKKHLDNMFSSDNPWGYIKKRLNDILD